MLRGIEVFPLPVEAGASYGAIRLSLRSRGLPIGEYDPWIAAQAYDLQAVPMTDNEREFRRVEGLAVENCSPPDAGQARRSRITTSTRESAAPSGRTGSPASTTAWFGASVSRPSSSQ